MFVIGLVTRTKKSFICQCMLCSIGAKVGSSLSQGSAEAVRDAVQALSSETIGVKVVAMGVGPVSAGDAMQAQAMGASIIAFNVKTAGADVDSVIKQSNISMMSHRVIYSLLDEVGPRPYPHRFLKPFTTA